MRPSIRAAALSLIFTFGCSWGSGPGPGTPQEIAYILLIDQNGNNDTPHLPLYPGTPVTLNVRLYRADRSQITSIPGGVTCAFAFTPTTLAAARPTADPLSETIEATDVPGTEGTFSVTLRFPAETLTKTFGPFSVLVH